MTENGQHGVGLKKHIVKRKPFNSKEGIKLRFGLVTIDNVGEMFRDE